jgi:hydroxymethylpyrimidine kinase/phosphomethylpyrimidine kinase
MSISPERLAIAMTIAGHDPSGGAGIVADLRTFDELGVYGVAVATSITYQNSVGVHGRFDLFPDLVVGQLDALLQDRVPSAFKVGMLGRTDTIAAVTKILAEHHSRPVVLDPVLKSSSGEPLIEKGGVEAIDRMLPVVTVVTPNKDELTELCGFEVFDVADVKAAALMLVKKGAKAVLVTGVKIKKGSRAESFDVLLVGDKYHVYSGPWVEDLSVHGSGCVLSSAIAAFLAMGRDVRTSVSMARNFTLAAMKNSIKPGEGPPFASPRGGRQRRPKDYYSFVTPSAGV